MRVRSLLLLAFVASTFTLSACNNAPPPLVIRDVPEPWAGIPTWRELAERYNRNLQRFDRLWARADVELTWTDEDGDRRFESGDDSRLIMLDGDKLALSIGKLGQEFAWIGYDVERYWMFDLDKDVLYVGRHENYGKPGTRRLPSPVKPMDLPHMLGLVKLDPENPPRRPHIMWLNGHYVVEPPGANIRISIDPNTCLPVRVDALDWLEHSRAIGRLSQHGAVTLDKTPKPQWPLIAKRLDVTMVGRDELITLKLWDMQDGKRRRRIKSRQFDLEQLRNAFEPKRVVDLDAPPQRPSEVQATP